MCFFVFPENREPGTLARIRRSWSPLPESMLSVIAAVVVAATVDDSGCGPREELDDTVRRPRRRGQPSTSNGQCCRPTTIRPDLVAGLRWNRHPDRCSRRVHRRHRQPSPAQSSTATGSANTTSPSSKSTGSRRRPSSRRPLDGGGGGGGLSDVRAIRRYRSSCSRRLQRHRHRPHRRPASIMKKHKREHLDCGWRR